jgi:hypothetical protein
VADPADSGGPLQRLSTWRVYVVAHAGHGLFLMLTTTFATNIAALLDAPRVG